MVYCVTSSSRYLAMTVAICVLAVAAAMAAAELPVILLHQEENENASAVWADPLSVEQGYLIRNSLNDFSPSCTFPFEPVGESCFYFSEELRNYHGALEYCESLSQHESKVSVAMLDYDGELDDLLLNKVVSMQKSFWVGGSRNDGVSWKWEDGRNIYMDASFWYRTEPNEPENNCAFAGISSSGNNVRSYIYDGDCTESLNFICQTGCPFEFERIGSFCYLFSEKEGLPQTTWQSARDQCLALDVPAGYHADMAVLGRSDQDTYRLISSISEANNHLITWLGAFATSDCVFEWVDGRSFSTSSHYWGYSQPDCGSQDGVYLDYDSTYNRTFIGDNGRTGTESFVCQMFKD